MPHRVEKGFEIGENEGAVAKDGFKEQKEGEKGENAEEEDILFVELRKFSQSVTSNIDVFPSLKVSVRYFDDDGSKVPSDLSFHP